MIYGYAREFSRQEGINKESAAEQAERLKSAGASVIYSDTSLSPDDERPELESLISIAEAGDTIAVSNIDVLIYNLEQGLDLIDRLNDHGVSVNIMSMGTIDDSMKGRLIRNIISAIAKWQKDRSEAQAAGSTGKHRKYTDQEIEKALKLLETLTYAQVSELTGISKSTIARAKAARKKG